MFSEFLNCVNILTTKSEISNAPFESRNIHLKIDATTSKNEHLINVVIIEMDSNKKSYIKTGFMTSTDGNDGEVVDLYRKKK